MRQHSDSDLSVAAPAFGEQRTNWTVDQTRGQRVLFSRAALALEIATGDATCGIVFFRVVDGQREEVDAFLRLFCCDDRGEHGGLAVGGDHSTIGLARDLPGLKG